MVTFARALATSSAAASTPNVHRPTLQNVSANLDTLEILSLDARILTNASTTLVDQMPGKIFCLLDAILKEFNLFLKNIHFLIVTNFFLTLLSRCVNEGGSHKCTCPRGSTGEPYTIGCTGSSRVECELDQDCPGQLACQDSACINPCSTLPCGENAVCVPEDHAAWCRYKIIISNNSNLSTYTPWPSRHQWCGLSQGVTKVNLNPFWKYFWVSFLR